MRQYRLLEIATQYDHYLRKFYRVHNNFEVLSYDGLFSLVAEDIFGPADFIHLHLRNMGIESKLVFYNNRNLQRKWNPDLKEKSLFEILRAQIKDFVPDIIFISNMHIFSKEEISAMRESLLPKNIKIVGFHYTTLSNVFLRNAAVYDQIYTGNSVYADRMRKHGLPAYLLRHAFEPSILYRLPECEKINELCFSGSIFTGSYVHNNRLDLLDKLIKAGLPYVFYGNIFGSIQDILSEENGKRYIGIIADVVKNMKQEVFGAEYYSILNNYGICLNVHGGTAEDGVGNMRMFEVTGIGSCLLTDGREGNSELFEEDVEIMTYHSFDEMVEKARWLMEHPKKAREIAVAGQRKTCKKYTYKNKAECLDAYIQELLNG